MTADLARLLLGAHELMNMIGNYVPPCTCLRVTVPHLFPAIFDTQIQMSRDVRRAREEGLRSFTALDDKSTSGRSRHTAYRQRCVPHRPIARCSPLAPAHRLLSAPLQADERDAQRICGLSSFSRLSRTRRAVSTHHCERRRSMPSPPVRLRSSARWRLCAPR